MKKAEMAARISLLALGLALAGCGGGGGVASTPTPPAPAPPPPAPPPPPPPPPPTTANADLINLTQSETFTNGSRSGAVSYPKATGAFTASASAGPVNIVYDASTQTYALTSGSRTQSFAPAEVDATTSTGLIKVYKKTSGTTTDTLTLTRPGTAGSLYRYVGGAYWQRTVDGATAISGDFDAVAYGVETPDSAVVRTGGATYATTLLGVVARPDNLYATAGEATLTVNFLSGAISGRSLPNGLRETVAETGAPGRRWDWQFNGNLAGATNAITGTMTLGVASTDSLSGSASGRLYGPVSNEIGLAFQASGADGTRAVGTILGRKSSDTITGTNPSLTDLQFDETFVRRNYGSVAYQSTSNAGLPSVFSSGYFIQPFPYELRYKTSNREFSLVDSGDPSSPTIISTLGTSDASLTDSKFLGYSNNSATSVARLRMYRVGSSNSEVALTYSSFYNLVHIKQNVGGLPNSWFTKNFWIPFGVATANAAMPTTGTASYAGFLHGNAIDGYIDSPTATVSGTIAIGVNFGTAAVSGSISPIITYSTGTTFALGTYSFDRGSYENPGVNRFGVIGSPTIGATFAGGVGSGGPAYNGLVSGTFFGPAAQELTGSFEAQYVPAGTSGILGRVWGAFATTKGP